MYTHRILLILAYSLVASSAVIFALDNSNAVSLESKVEVESWSEGRMVSNHEVLDKLFLGDSWVLNESKNQTRILNFGAQEMILIYHHLKIYERTKLPFRLEDHATDAQLAEIERLTPLLGTVVEIEEADDLVPYREWNVRKAHALATMPGLAASFEMDLMLTTEPDIDYALYDRASTTNHSIGAYTREWIDQIIALDGLAVFQKLTMTMNGGRHRHVQTSEVTSIEPAVVPLEKLEPPAEYREVPFELSRHFAMNRPRAKTPE